MDAKLKTLKVAELKEILAGVGLPSTARTKADLVAKILDNPIAVDAYRAKYDPTPAPEPVSPAVDDLLAPPEEIDWTVEDPTLSPALATAPLNPAPIEAPPSSIKSPPALSTHTPTTLAPDASDPSSEAARLKARAERFGIPVSADADDPEAIKRKARAERFNVPLVQPKPSKPHRATSRIASNIKPSPKAVSAQKLSLDDPKASSKPIIDPKKLEERAARFGLKPNEKIGSLKRPFAAVEEVDAEEQERRRRRAERFGLSTKA